VGSGREEGEEEGRVYAVNMHLIIIKKQG